MSYPTCRHVKEDGRICQAPAMRREHYCYFHHNHRARRLKIAQARARGEHIWLDLPPLEDMLAVQAAISQVVEAVAARVIDRRDARVLLTALRLAASNFRTSQPWSGRSRFETDEMHETVASYPGLAGEYGLPPNTDLDAHPEELFPPATPKRGAPPAAHFTGHRRSAVACRTAPGILDTCKRLGPDDQLMLLHEMRNAIAVGLGKKPPSSAGPLPTPDTRSGTSASQ